MKAKALETIFKVWTIGVGMVAVTGGSDSIISLSNR
jgi:hypothetical protein